MYYDTTMFSCVMCSENSRQASSGVECVCNNGFRVDPTTQFNFVKTCIACEVDTAPTFDGTLCLPCSADATFNTVLGQCQCPEGFKTSSINEEGTRLTEISCF